MSSVTYPALSGTISASELNTNFSDVVNLASSVGNEQLAGGITSDKLSDKYTISYDTISLLPNTAPTGTAVADAPSTLWTLSAPSTKWDAYQWQPILETGKEAYLCSIQVFARETDVANPVFQFYLNGSSSTGSLIAGTGVTIAAENTLYTLANDNPITNPLLAISNGDYITITVYGGGGGSVPTFGGLFVKFCVKYVLTS